jgi:hypothetical protein
MRGNLILWLKSVAFFLNIEPTPSLHLKVTLILFSFYLFIGGTRIWTQDIILARQALYHLNHSTSPRTSLIPACRLGALCSTCARNGETGLRSLVLVCWGYVPLKAVFFCHPTLYFRGFKNKVRSLRLLSLKIKVLFTHDVNLSILDIIDSLMNFGNCRLIV